MKKILAILLLSCGGLMAAPKMEIRPETHIQEGKPVPVMAIKVLNARANVYYVIHETSDFINKKILMIYAPNYDGDFTVYHYIENKSNEKCFYVLEEQE